MFFEAVNETREKFGVILLLSKIKSGAKRVVFCSYRCFLESEKLRCEKKISKRAKFFVHVRHFKAFFYYSCEAERSYIAVLLVFTTRIGVLVFSRFFYRK